MSTIADLEAAWRAAGALGWTKKQCAAAQTILDRWHPEYGDDPVAFLSWTVTHWRVIERKCFKGMRVRPPHHPEIGFVAKFLWKYVDAWCHRDAVEACEVEAGLKPVFVERIAKLHEQAAGYHRQAAIVRQNARPDWGPNNPHPRSEAVMRKKREAERARLAALPRDKDGYVIMPEIDPTAPAKFDDPMPERPMPPDDSRDW
jgi:hypothetical protein